MESTENHPSLINCLNKRTRGIFIDLTPAKTQSSHQPSVIHTAPYSKIVGGDIKTDGNCVLQRVLLVMQRDDYDIADALVPLSNPQIEAAWQRAAAFHQRSESETQPFFFRQQFDQAGDLQPHRALFRCTLTDRWFHPVCPQCAQALTLCRDDGLLEKLGAPTYSTSHERFLYCRSCAGLSGAATLYVRRKTTRMPGNVLDKNQLIDQWKQLAGNRPQGNGLPCEGCSQIDACWGAGAKAGERIDCFSFYPFFMLMAPAPAYSADRFIRVLSGDPQTAPAGDESPSSEPSRPCFFFEGRDRLFLEILYLKLTFLSQLCRQLMPTDGPEMDLTLESIGVDLAPSGTGLPSLWQFRTRMLNLIGCNQPSPFAPMVPEAPRLHFLGTVWMRTLLVNSDQTAERIFPRIARIVQAQPSEQDWMSLPIDISDPDGPLAGGQIFWTPQRRTLPPDWQANWIKGLRMGFHLINAGLKTGQPWDAGMFISMLDDLRDDIRQDLFTGSVVAHDKKAVGELPGDMQAVLSGILDKWKTQAAILDRQALASDAAGSGTEVIRRDVQQRGETESTSQPATMVQDESTPMMPADTAPSAPDVPQQEADGSMEDWQDPQQTIVLKDVAQSPTPAAPQDEAPAVIQPETSWDNDADQTVILQPDGSLPEANEPVGDMDATIVTSPAAVSAGSGLSNEDDDLEATMLQSPSPSVGDAPETASGLSQPGEFENDLQATVVINPTKPPAGQQPLQETDDDLATTLIQGSNQPPSIPSDPLHPPANPPAGPSQPTDDLEATMVINPANRMQPASTEAPPSRADDDLEATLIETPRQGGYSGKENPQSPSAAPLQGTSRPPTPEGPDDQNDGFDDDDDVMEQTVIIRSTIKKE